MNIKAGTIATVRFEFQRSLTLGRASAFAILSLFPPCITLISNLTPAGALSWLPIALTTLVVCLLSNLLWATPVVYNELEGRTWIFGTSRPSGRYAMLLGKYIVSVIWTSAVCGVAVTLSTIILAIADPLADSLKIYVVLMGVSALATVGYAATFTLIGTLFHRKSMMVAIAYCLVSEVAVASIPALIGQLAVRSHLTHIIVYTLLPEEMQQIAETQLRVGEKALWIHGFSVLAIAAVALGLAAVVIRFREYITADET